MAGVMIHLAVADAAAELLDIKNKELFFTGNIAPDCIHSRENYCREMKQHTHLKDGIRDGELLCSDTLSMYRERLDSFAEKYCRREREDFELYLGYYTHLVTDELFIRTVRREFAEQAEKDGILQTDKAFFYEIMRDINGIDSVAAKEYPFFEDIQEFLKAPGIGCDYVTQKETWDSKQWILNNFYSDKELPPPVRISYERMLDFISQALWEILKRTERFFPKPDADEMYMKSALVLAKRAADMGEVPVGAVVVKKTTGEIVGTGYNRRETDRNPLAHGEIAAIKEASERLGGWRLIDCEMYVTLEPCPMCCGAIINSRVERVVFGACDLKSGSAQSVTELFKLPYNHSPELLGGVLEDKCSRVLSWFFKRLRKKKQGE